jgi:hypothetical protein
LELSPLQPWQPLLYSSRESVCITPAILKPAQSVLAQVGLSLTSVRSEEKTANWGVRSAFKYNYL